MKFFASKILYRFVLILLLGMGITVNSHAQSQELQQLVLDIEKLSQFKKILSDMKSGYEIVSKGYNTIRDLSQGNFDLHKAFLDGLLTVNPALRKYQRVADIIQYEATILKEYKSAYNRFKSSGLFTVDEIQYMGKVYSNLFDESLQNLDELTIILTDSQLRMDDDERMEGIDRIYQDMQEKLGFLRAFDQKVSTLETQRTLQKQNADILKQLYGGDK